MIQIVARATMVETSRAARALYGPTPMHIPVLVGANAAMVDGTKVIDRCFWPIYRGPQGVKPYPSTKTYNHSVPVYNNRSCTNSRCRWSLYFGTDRYQKECTQLFTKTIDSFVAEKKIVPETFWIISAVAQVKRSAASTFWGLLSRFQPLLSRL